MYSDTCCPISIPENNGELYFDPFIDDLTRQTVTFLMETKTDTLSNMKRCVSRMHRNRYDVQTLRTEQVTEYS